MKYSNTICRPLFLLLFYEAKLCLRKLILFLSFSQATPLHISARHGHLDITRLLVESKADVAARNWCFSPPPSHHLSLTICLAAMAELHSNGPQKPTLLHTCAASARLNDAPRVAAGKLKQNSRRVLLVLLVRRE
jgi:ankyrin repeat protein